LSTLDIAAGIKEATILKMLAEANDVERMCRLADAPDEVKVEFLRKHLRNRHGVDVVSLDQLERGVLALHLADGRHWVVRVFSPHKRALDLVEGDATILQFLEQNNLSAERCAVAAPVSVLGEYSLLVTNFVPTCEWVDGLDTLHACGDLLGRLHLLRVPSPDGPLTREAASLHHYAPGGGGLDAELKAAEEWLGALQNQIPESGRQHYERLREEIGTADAGRDLPAALVHPDPVLKNFLLSEAGQPILIDWTGAGLGPRLASLAILLWSSALENGSWSAQRVDAVVAGYRSHIALEPLELERLEAVMRIRPLVFACWRYRHALRSGRIPDGREWWWPKSEITQAVANRAVSGLAHRR
jgi:Ser/Thr protein kinase RdoA (MazF antagonist)